MSDRMPLLVVGVLVACALVMYLLSLYRRVRQRGGMAGVLVGADIERTVDSVDAYSSGMSSAVMRVHRFAYAPSDRSVGLELVLRTRASYNAMTAGLSAAQARQLAQLLRRGCGDPPVRNEPVRNVRDGPV